ncbi:hypothetical protein BG003_002561, partial [Podila horticola]
RYHRFRILSAECETQAREDVRSKHSVQSESTAESSALSQDLKAQQPVFGDTTPIASQSSKKRVCGGQAPAKSKSQKVVITSARSINNSLPSSSLTTASSNTSSTADAPSFTFSSNRERLLRECQDGGRLYMTEEDRFGLEPRDHAGRKKFGFLAQMVHGVFSRFMDPERTTFHVDGKPSIQNTTPTSPTNITSELSKHTASPPELVEEVLSELVKKKWNICRCTYQADACIARIAEKSTTDIGVVTGDSDLIMYEDIKFVTMPVRDRKNTTYRTFSKADLIARLKLRDPRQLLIAALFSANDYSKGVGLPFKNINDQHVGTQQQTREKEVESGIKQFCKLVKGLDIDWSILRRDLEFAFEAFVGIHEDNPNQNATESYRSQEKVSELLTKLYTYRETMRLTSKSDGPKSQKELPER